jgi:hypothetical protein
MPSAPEEGLAPSSIEVTASISSSKKKKKKKKQFPAPTDTPPGATGNATESGTPLPSVSLQRTSPPSPPPEDTGNSQDNQQPPVATQETTDQRIWNLVRKGIPQAAAVDIVIAASALRQQQQQQQQQRRRRARRGTGEIESRSPSSGKVAASGDYDHPEPRQPDSWSSDLETPNAAQVPAPLRPPPPPRPPLRPPTKRKPKPPPEAPKFMLPPALPHRHRPPPSPPKVLQSKSRRAFPSYNDTTSAFDTTKGLNGGGVSETFAAMSKYRQAAPWQQKSPTTLDAVPHSSSSSSSSLSQLSSSWPLSAPSTQANATTSPPSTAPGEPPPVDLSVH